MPTQLSGDWLDATTLGRWQTPPGTGGGTRMNAQQLQTELVLREARHGDRIQDLRGWGRPAPSVQGPRGMNASGWMRGKDVSEVRGRD